MTGPTDRDHAAWGRLTCVAFNFDESLLEPGQLEREIFTSLLTVIPEERRDLRVALKLFLPRLEPAWPTPTALAVALLAGTESGLRTTHSIDGLTALLRSVPMAYVSIVGLRVGDLDVLHEDLLDRSASYLGMVELDHRLRAHVEFYADYPQFRIVGTELRLLYSAFRYSPELGVGEGPEASVDEWRAEGQFSSVDLEEDEVRSDYDRKAAELYEKWLRDGEDVTYGPVAVKVTVLHPRDHPPSS